MHTLFLYWPIAWLFDVPFAAGVHAGVCYGFPHVDDVAEAAAAAMDGQSAAPVPIVSDGVYQDLLLSCCRKHLAGPAQLPPAAPAAPAVVAIDIVDPGARPVTFHFESRESAAC